MLVRLPSAPRSALLALLLTGCTTVSTSAVSTSASGNSLDGTEWILAALPGTTLAPGSSVTLGFADGRVAGTDGCNRYTAPYKSSGSGLELTGDAAGTLMACPPPIMAQADAYLASLKATRSYRLASGDLELLGANGNVVARFTAQPRALAGTTWEVNGYNNGRGGVTSVLGGTRLDVAFGADGRASGSAGCNRWTGSWTAGEGSLTIGNAAATRRMCLTPDGVMAQEQEFLTALGTVATARREADRLELRRADGALALSLRRVQ